MNKVPWVLDPVGAGASISEYRNKNAYMELLNLKPTVLRGNASEIDILHLGYFYK